MIVCLDTNAYSHIKRKKKLLCDCVDEADNVILPIIVLGELMAGFETGTRKAENIASLEKFLTLQGVEIAYLNRETTERYGVLYKILRTQGTPIPTNDIWIAAISMETGSRLISYDEHFNNVPGLFLLTP